MTRLRGLAPLLVAMGLAIAPEAVAAPPASSAAPPAAPTRHVSLDASATFGADAPTGDGWLEVVARVDNGESSPLRGTLRVYTGGLSSAGLPSGDRKFEARSTLVVPPRSSVIVHLPVEAGAVIGPVSVAALGDDGAVLANTSLSLPTSSAPLLVDVDQPSRLAIVLRGWPMAPAWSPGRSYAPPTSVALGVGVPAVDAATGDPVLPERAAGYGPVTAVLLRSDRLAHLEGDALSALVGWVLSGGTLAVVPTRPEDLRAGVLTTLAGGVVSEAPPPPVMMALPSVKRSAAPPSLGAPPPSTPTPEPEPELGDDGGATPIHWFVPARTTPLGPTRTTGPSPALRAKLHGYSGGNLKATAFGASAPYGLGQVHLLGFDPTTSPALEDGWMHARMLDLVADAWDRKALVAFPQGAGDDRTSSVFQVQRALDPNQNFRPALGIAAVLLVLYSIIAGPLTFLRARSKGRPLDPYVRAPVASAVCFGAVVLVGLAGKGWGGRARHLGLVEAGAGMSRGTAHRFRGLFASQSKAMHVRGLERLGVLDVLANDSPDKRAPVLAIDKEGTTLEELSSLPWQTVVVSEDGFADIGAGIAVHTRPDGSVAVTNRTGRKLVDVVVWAPSTDASWFASVDPGATIVSTAGRTLFQPATRLSTTAGTRSVHQLDTARFHQVLGGAPAEEMTSAWSALSAAAGSAVDWWPDDAPVVIGELSGGDGVRSDTGLRVESDRMMFRVVGEGGAP